MNTFTQLARIIHGDNADGKLKGAVATQRKAMRARQTRCPHTTYTLSGGPLDNASIDLSGPSTGIFTIGDVRGRYTQSQCLPDALASIARLITDEYKRALHGNRMLWRYPDPPILFWMTC